jgi:uncharacterized protein
LSDVHALIEADSGLSKLFAEVRERMKGDPGHDLAHLLRVADWTLRLGEGALPSRLAVAAALLHDIVNVPKNSPDRARASELSAEFSKKYLPTVGFSPDEVEEIAIAVRQHSFSRGEKPERLLAKCLQDSDRLEALGAIGIYRVFATGVQMGASLSDPEDPWAKRRELDDRAYSVDHFFRKLFKLPDLMTTPAGRLEAQRRAGVMREYLEQLGYELGFPLKS